MEEPQGGRSSVSYGGAVDADRLQNMRLFTHVLYALYAVHWFTGGVTGLIAIILDYVKRSDAAGTPYAAHFEWQIRTFWTALVGYLIGAALIVVAIGVPIIAAVSIWVLYRIVKGWLYLYENKPLEPHAWF
ncbi:DUF4870 family protein [Trinickia fusca]|uniref:Transmembrane protein n=1 Tax=Trinickia fusca TaxID=2419777 RepID=A0A494X736_9BURK|nr:hypothetical protein [Trinickia fusca]RKP44004.1 hypothetical protein D7S89_24035 [Trinickia fusca]